MRKLNYIKNGPLKFLTAVPSHPQKKKKQNVSVEGIGMKNLGSGPSSTTDWLCGLRELTNLSKIPNRAIEITISVLLDSANCGEE